MNTTPGDILYQQSEQEIAKIRQRNLENLPGNGRQFSWEINQFAGFVSNQPQQTINNQLYGSASINISIDKLILEKPPGAQAVGYFRDIDPFNRQLNLMCGTLDIRRKGYYLFCVVQDQSTDPKTASFYIIKDDELGKLAIDGIWRKVNPVKYTRTELFINNDQQTFFVIPDNVRVYNVLLNGQIILPRETPESLTGYAINDGTLDMSNRPVNIGERLAIVYTSAPQPEEYKFKGTYFDYVIDKSFLYFCSGEEEYTDLEGNTSGLLRLDLEALTDGAVDTAWVAVPTGRAAKLDLSRSRDIIYNEMSNGYNGDDPSVYINSPLDFNPSIVEVYQDRLLISGAKNNPYQVKVSEYQNMRNFVSNVLGYTAIPTTEEDRRRPSTFFVKEAVKSMSTFGDNVLIGVTNKFYSYALIEVNNADLDRVLEDNSATSGPINNKTCKVFREGQFFYASNYQVVPELNQRILESKISAFGKPYSVASSPQKLTTLVDNTMRQIDPSNSTVGIYKNSILWSVAYCNQEDPTEGLDPETGFRKQPVRNNLTVVYSRSGDIPGYTLWNHIRANYFAEIGNRGLLYSSADNGNVYKVNEDIFYIDNHLPTAQDPNGAITSNLLDYPSTYQTGLIGFNPKRDSRWSKKRMKSLYFSGGFAGGNGQTVLEVSIYKVGNVCDDKGQSGCCEEPLHTETIILEDPCEPRSCDCDLIPNLNYFRGAKYTKRYIDIPEHVIYNEIFISFKIVNTSLWHIDTIGGTYELVDGEGFDNDLRLCPKKDDLGNDLIQEFHGRAEGAENLVIEDCKTCGI